MDDFLATLKARHSYRGAFLPAPVARGTLERIIEAGRAAPSACNKQSPRFIAIDDETVMASIKALPDLAACPAVQTARAFILVVLDPAPQYGETSFGPEDCGAATTNMLNAVTASGLASVWLDGVLRGDTGAALGALLNIPPPFSARILLPLGVPEKPGLQPARKPAGQRVGWNTFTPAMA